jgi:hypothetical protein
MNASRQSVGNACDSHPDNVQHHGIADHLAAKLRELRAG